MKDIIERDAFKCEQQTKAHFHKQRASEICMRSEIYSQKPEALC